MKQNERAALSEQAIRYLERRHRMKKWALVVILMSAMVGGGVYLSLRYHGMAMTNLQKHYVCEYEVHEHTEECYDTDEEGNSFLVCGYADYVVHVHNDDCYEEGELICLLPEIEAHVHTEDCYREITYYIDEQGNEIEAEPVKFLAGNIEETQLESLEAPKEDSEQETVVTDEVASPEEEIPEENDENTETEPEDETDELQEETSDLEGEPVEEEADTLETEEIKEIEEREYFTKKILICDKLELHTHTEECYDDDHNLICGLLQLEEHVHSKECFTFEDHKKTNKAQASTMVHKSSHYSVTAKYGEEAMIPEEACFVVKEITQKNNPEVYEESVGELETLTDSEGYTLAYLLDIGFYIDEDEIEPSGPVDVTIELLDEAVVEENANIAIVHFDHEGQTTKMDNTELEDGKTTFQTDSFSVYAVVVKKTKTELSVGQYGNYSFEYNKEENAFLKSSFYNPENVLGICGNFHIVAFDTVRLEAHTNGNVLAKNLYTNSNFGTNNLPSEVSYIQNYLQVASNSGTSMDNVWLVLGDSAVVTAVDNGNHLAVNGRQIDSPKHIMQDVNTDMAPYVNMDTAEQEIRRIAQQLASHGNEDVTYYKKDANEDGYILSNPDTVGYYNITGEEFSKLSNNNVFLDGFSEGHYGSMIINVDCSGLKELNFPQRLKMKIDGNEVNPQERTNFNSGKIIWNFINAEGVDIKGQLTIGTMVAPGANINIGQNVDGTLIAENVTVKAQSHRNDFTGITISADINARKLVNSITPTEDQIFYFDLFKWNGSEWVFSQQQQNTLANVGFTLTYDDKDVDKSFYYLLKESDTNVSQQYKYDTSIYVFKITIRKDGPTLSKEIERYKLKDGASTSDIVINGNLNKNCFTTQSSIDLREVIFENESETTSISVEKYWLDEYGNPADKDLPEKVIVTAIKCYYIENADHTVVEHREVTDQTAVLSEENHWQYTFDSLPLYEVSTIPGLEGELLPLYYFIEETDVIKNDQTVKSQFLITYSHESPIRTGTQKITNQPLVVEKEMEKPLLIKKNWLDADGKPASSIFETEVAFELYQVQIPDASALLPTSTELYGTYKVKASKLWETAIEKLPLQNTVNGVKYTYQYYVKEVIPEGSDYRLTGYEWSLDGGKLLVDCPSVVDGMITIKNQMTVTDIEVQKYWYDSDGNRMIASETTESSINVQVYQTLASDMNDTDVNKDVLIGEYKLTPNSVSKISQSDDKYQVALREESDIKQTIPWSLHLTNLPACDTQGRTYYYYVVETKIGEVNADNQVIYDITYADAPIQSGLLTIHNKGVERYELPSTGGKGTFLHKIRRWFR